MTAKSGAITYLWVGDHRRSPIGRAIKLSLLVTIVFVAFAVGVKDNRAVRPVRALER